MAVKVAVKVVDENHLDGEYERKALKREIEILQMLDHPNCVLVGSMISAVLVLI